MEPLRKLRANFEAWFTRLASRERIMVSLAGVAVALFIVFIAFTRAQRGITEREAIIDRKTQVLAQIGKLALYFIRKRMVLPFWIVLNTDLQAQGAQLQAAVVTEGTVQTVLKRVRGAHDSMTRLEKFSTTTSLFAMSCFSSSKPIGWRAFRRMLFLFRLK